MAKMSKEERAIRNAKIEEMFESGMSVKEIAAKCELKEVSIYKICNNSGVKRPEGYRTINCNRKFSDAQLLELINKECSFREAAKILGVSWTNVSRRAHSLGISSPALVNAEKIAKMYELRDCGYTNVQIGKRIGVSWWTVRRYIGNQPEEINAQSQLLAGKKRSAAKSAVKAARKAMIDKREAERLAAIEAERVRIEEMLREEERMEVQNTLTEILGFEHPIASAAEGRELIMKIASKFEMKVAA